MKRRLKGEISITLLISVLIGLALLAMLLYLSYKYVYTQPNKVLTDVTRCGISDMKGECLDAYCSGRPGWTPVAKYTCPDNKPMCCILKEPTAWFTPGSIMLVHGGEQERLTSDEEYSAKGILSSDEQARLTTRYTVGKKEAFSIYYIPRVYKVAQSPGSSTGTRLVEKKDVTCTLKVKDAIVRTIGTTTSPCYDLSSGTYNSVKLWEGTGEALEKKVGAPGNAGYTFKINVVNQQQSGSVTQTYTDVLKIT